jgi:short-subunit dehydrogenase
MTVLDVMKSTTRIMLVMTWSIYMFTARIIENTLYFVHDITMLFMRIITLNQVPVFASRTYYQPAHTRYILVTGTSSGIGNDCALHFARMGYSVIATVMSDHEVTKWKQIQGSASGMKGKIVPIVMDIGKDDSIERGVDQLKQILRDSNGKLVGLVNNAGISGPFCPFELVNMDTEMDAMHVNWRGTLVITQKCLPLLRESKGRIIALSSIGSRLHLPWMTPYTMSKSALEAFCDSLRLEVINYGVSISMIEPGEMF